MQNQFLKKLSIGTLVLQTIVSIIMVFAVRGAVFAQATGQTPSSTPPLSSTHFDVNKYLTTTGQTQSYFKSNNPIASFIIQIINFLVLMIGSLCFLALVIGGFLLLTSHGNEGMTTKGKEAITSALIGLVITLSAYFITAFVQSIFYEIPGK